MGKPEEGDERKNSLLYWASTLSSYKSHAHQSGSTTTITVAKAKVEDFEDGQLLLKILREDIDSSYFSTKTDPLNEDDRGNTNIMNNRDVLKSGIDMMKKYYAQQEGGHLIPLYLTPSAAIISLSRNRSGGIANANNTSTNEVLRLLQLLLVCAVNCPHAPEFMDKIHSMNKKIQTQLMSVIMELTQSTEDTLEPANQQRDEHKNEISLLHDAKKELNQTCFDLRRRLSELTEEKANLALQNERLTMELSLTKKQYHEVQAQLQLQRDIDTADQQQREKEMEKVTEKETLHASLMTNLKENLESLKSEKTALQAQNLAQKQEVEELKSQLDFRNALENTNHNLQLDLEKLTAYNTKLKKENVDMAKTLEDTQNSHKREIDQQLDIIKTLRASKMSLEKETQKFAEVERNLRLYYEKKIEEAEEKVRTVQCEREEKATSLNLESDQLRLQIVKLDEELQQAREKISRLSIDQAVCNERKLELEKASRIQENEEKLLMSTFYNYGIQLHRYVVDERQTSFLNNFPSSSSMCRNCNKCNNDTENSNSDFIATTSFIQAHR